MNLVKGTECERKVSDQATICQYCEANGGKETQKIKIIEEQKMKKENDKNLKMNIENNLRNIFKNCFESDGLQMGTIKLSLIVTRNEILKNVAKDAFERDYIDRNYERILNNVKKIYENDEKATKTLLQIQLQEQQNKYTKQQTIKKEKEQKKLIIQYIFLYVFRIICSPIGLLLFFLVLFIWGYFAFAEPVLNA